MARKAVEEKTVARQKINGGILSLFKLGESYTSLLLGVVIVVIVVVLVFSFAKNRKVQQTSSTQDRPTSKQEKVDKDKKGDKSPKIYTVKKGDDLWSISDKMYKSGYYWVDIAKANNLIYPDFIFPGDKLTIPELKIKQSEAIKTSAIKEDSYKVLKGDSLWDIAVRAYGDGFRWVEIAKANKLSNPDLIFSENVLKIPR